MQFLEYCYMSLHVAQCKVSVLSMCPPNFSAYLTVLSPILVVITWITLHCQNLHWSPLNESLSDPHDWWINGIDDPDINWTKGNKNMRFLAVCPHYKNVVHLNALFIGPFSYYNTTQLIKIHTMNAKHLYLEFQKRRNWNLKRGGTGILKAEKLKFF